MTDATQQRIPGPLPSYSEAMAKAAKAQLPETVTELAPQARIRDAAFVSPAPVDQLAKGIAGVMAEVGTISKSGFNKFHQYHYATLQDLLYAITPLMGKHGVVVIQHELERILAENRVMVTYEFSLFHTSGQIWPEKPRFTGMSIGRNSKGEYDDKAINKCHSAARKYFLLSLFQVPSGDFEDADEGPEDAGQTGTSPQSAPARQAPVPGPVPGPPSAPIDVTKPHKLERPKGGAVEWAESFIKAIGTAKTRDELDQWDKHNEAVLNRLYTAYRPIHNTITAAVERRMMDIQEPPDPDIDPDTGEVLGERPSDVEMPNPAGDPTEAINWVAQMLTQFKTLSAASIFWNDIVLPRAREFEALDFDVLRTEWRATEARLAGS